MKTYEYRKMRGICVECGREPAEPGRVRCAACLAKQAEYEVLRRSERPDTMMRTEKENARRREIRAERAKKGLCTECGRKAWNGDQIVYGLLPQGQRKGKTMERPEQGPNREPGAKTSAAESPCRRDEGRIAAKEPGMDGWTLEASPCKTCSGCEYLEGCYQWRCWFREYWRRLREKYGTNLSV